MSDEVGDSLGRKGTNREDLRSRQWTTLAMFILDNCKKAGYCLIGI